MAGGGRRVFSEVYSRTILKYYLHLKLVHPYNTVVDILIMNNCSPFNLCFAVVVHWGSVILK